MAETRRGLTAEERMRELQRDQAALRRERMLREVAGPRWRRMVRTVPVLFRLQGQVVARVLQADPESVIHALRADAVFALDTAMRLAHGFGFLSVREGRLIRASRHTTRFLLPPQFGDPSKAR